MPGWESVFYLFGIVAIVWCILWSLLVYDTPESHPFISKAERNYITSAIQSQQVNAALCLHPMFRFTKKIHYKDSHCRTCEPRFYQYIQIE